MRSGDDFGAVAFRSTLVIPTLNRTGEAFTSADADYVHEFASSEDISSQSLAHRVFRLFSQSVFTEIFNRIDTGFFKLPLNRSG